MRKDSFLIAKAEKTKGNRVAYLHKGVMCKADFRKVVKPYSVIAKADTCKDS
jgi:hypothetical protein